MLSTFHTLALCDFHAVPVFRCHFFRIGEVDEQTESNFLKSLKRNIKLKQARQQKNADRTDAGGFQDRLGDVVF
ncbi:hypothetical protein EB796_002101 [Bugula neritina]|uniref:Uncharacterized protein n=1 Tax=Bugula neritina TaxID=10212 RepID=A0A7J7KN30_BUGNE|nr:hypothetical protein EB796_002101 [Bugula neritina]